MRTLDGPYPRALRAAARLARQPQCLQSLIPEGPALHAEDEAERLDMRTQVREREGGDFPLVRIVKVKGLRLAH